MIDNREMLSLVTKLAKMIRLNKAANETLAKLIRAVAMKDRSGSLDEMDYLLATFEYATGIVDRFQPKCSGHFFKGMSPTHLRDHDLTPVRISPGGIVYGWDRKKIGTLWRDEDNKARLDEDPKVSYTSIKEIRGETNE